MKHLTKSYAFMMLFCLGLSCSNEEAIISVEENATQKNKIDVSTLEVVDGKLQFTNKQSLKQFILETKTEDFKRVIMNLNEKGFSSLRPFFEENDNLGIDDFLTSKKSKIIKKGLLYSLKSNDDEIDLDDELVSDEGFAAVLNDEREIYIGDKFYKYTTNGLYFCEKKNEQILRDYLVDFENSITSKSDYITSRIAPCDAPMQKSSNDYLSIAPVETTETQITNEITLVQASCEGGGGGSSGGGSGGGSSGGGSSTSYPILKPQTFGSCVYSEDSIWQQVFGNRIKCNDYHDSTHRIQTQFWNENYFIFSSIGTKAKYQKKRTIGWSESGTAEFVELGINSVKYTYNHALKQYNPFGDTHVTYKYKGNTYSIETGQQTNFPANPNPWPIYDDDQKLYTLEIYIDDIYGKTIDEEISLTAGNLNSAVKELLKNAANSIPSWTGINSDLANNKVAVKVVKFGTSKTYMEQL